jgi:membrane protein required for colicin V production
VVLGLWRGLVFEVLSVAGWVCAFFWPSGCRRRGRLAALQNTAEPLRYAAGFMLVFVGVAFAAGLLAWLIKKGIDSVGLRPVDRMLGAAFGLLRGAVILLALALVVNMTPWKDTPPGARPWRPRSGQRLARAQGRDARQPGPVFP